MDYIYKDKSIKKYLEEHLKPHRIAHINSVISECAKLCKIYDGDLYKCQLAALFHDMAKGMSTEEMDEFISSHNLPKKYLNNRNLAHGKIAAEEMEKDWGITDREVINAVSYHTTGRANMSKTEKIVFIADAIEPLRLYPGVETLRKVTYEDLDKGCLFSLEETIKKLQDNGISPIDEDTLLAKESFEEIVKTNKSCKNAGRKEKTHMNSRDFALLAAKVLDKKKAEDITIFDIATKSSIADYMILASGSNERLIGALADEVEDEYVKEGLLVKSIEGKKESGWILMDFGDIIVNVLTLEMRDRYNIEKVWADCERLNWEE